MTTNQTRKNQNTDNLKDSSRDLLLEAQENAINAKEIAMEAVSRVSEERNAMDKLDETLAKILDEAEQCIQQRTGQKQETTPESHDNSFPDGPIDIYPEIKRKTVNPEINRTQQLEQLINDLTEERAQKKIEEIQEEARIYKIEAEKAINQARQEALSLAEKEVTKVREEIRLTKEAAENAVRQAQEEANRYREEAEKANNDARLAISLAQERVKAASEEIKVIQQQALVDANRARADVLKAKEEAETARRQSRKAISNAEAESQKAREEAELAKITAADIIRKAREESQKIKEEAETSITRANESLLQAKRRVVDMAQEDISKTRQAIEEPVRRESSVNPEIADDKKHQHLLEQLMEMHNPLHSISGFARMILDDNICDTVAQKEFVRTILQQSERLKLQLDDIHRSLKVNSKSQ